jgi:hydrogenase maturation factor
LQVLSASSTGTILAAVDPQDKDEIKQKLLEKGVDASFVGYFTKDQKRLLTRNGKDLPFPKVADDPYAIILSAKSRKTEITS